MQGYETIEYSVEYDDRQNADAYTPKRDPVWIDGKGKYTYRSDGSRWFSDDNGYSFHRAVPTAALTVVPER